MALVLLPGAAAVRLPDSRAFFAWMNTTGLGFIAGRGSGPVAGQPNFLCLDEHNGPWFCCQARQRSMAVAARHRHLPEKVDEPLFPALFLCYNKG